MPGLTAAATRAQGRQANGPGRRPATVRRVLAVTALAAPLALAGCSGGSAGTGQSAAASSSASAPSGAEGTLQAQFEQVINHVLPSVVEIRTPVGLGSGIVFDGKGDIVTNDHVVGNPPASQFQVSFSNGATPRPATLVGTYPPDDLAVIKVDNAGKLNPATFADSSKVDVGTIVLAMGNPLGLASSVTNGIVSAVGRTVSEPQSEGPGATLPDVIQTSAAINPGNSGGALVDLNGEVIGIPTLAATDPQLGGGAAPGIGFAIPSNIVKDIAGQLVKYGQVKNSHRAEIGIRATTVVDSQGHPAGVGVVDVIPGGPAAAAGIQPGDIVISVAGTDVADTQQLTAVLANQDVGAKVKVGYLRDGTQKTTQVTLGQLSGG